MDCKIRDNLQCQQCIWPRNCWRMYSAVVVQKVLQRRLEPWSWRVQWLSIRSWQWQLWAIIEADPLTNYMRSCQRIRHQPFCGHSAFKANCCSIAKLCLTLYDTMDCSMPGFPVLHELPESAQTHVHWVSDATQPSHPLLPTSPPALSLSQHQGLFQRQF